MQTEEKYRSWVEVNLDHFRHNWNEIRKLAGPGVKIMQVLKADAYGHGAIEISNAALKNGASCLGVANADEGVQLRVGGIEAPIVILGPSTDAEIPEIIKYRLVPSVSDPAFARTFQKRLEEFNLQMPVHIEIDTGMGRGGLPHGNSLQAVAEMATYPNIRIEGIYSHFSSAEHPGDDYNLRQWGLFRDFLEKVEQKGIHIPIRHMCNSGGLMNFPMCRLDMVRPGIMTYGVYPGEPDGNIPLLPVMSFKTSIVLIKDFPRGSAIGYNRTYITGRPTRIATIPVGYGDGYGTILSNRSEALIRGKRAPVVGRVSMDLCTIDVTHIPQCAVGDEVVLMGRQGDEYISANEIASKAGANSYEILCALGKRAPRVFLDAGRAGGFEPRLRRIFIPDEEKSIARIDNIVRKCLQAKARDPELGDAVYYEMFETLFGKENRPLELRTDFKYDIHVTEFSDAEKAADPFAHESFKIETRIEYSKVLKNTLILIGCALNHRQLSALFDDELCEYRWLLDRKDECFREGDFRIGAVRVDGVSIPIIGATQTDRGLEVRCGGEILKGKLHKQVRMEIDVVTRRAKNNNIFSVYIVYPTRGLDIAFNYEGAGLKNVKEICYFSGKNPQPRVLRNEGKSIELHMNGDEWVFPTSGVTFFWTA